MLAEPRDIENFFDHKRSAQQPGRRRPEKSNHRQQAALERVFVDDPELGNTLGTGGTDKILVEDFEHSRSCQPGDVSTIRRAQRHCRQDPVRCCIQSGHTENLPAQCEQQQQQRPDHKRRYTDPDHRQRHGRVVGHGVRLEPCNNTGAEPDDQCKGDRQNAQFQ